MSLVLLLTAFEGHVRLNYIDGSDMPIRNAGTATGNGRASVAGGLAGSKHKLCCRSGPKQPSVVRHRPWRSDALACLHRFGQLALLGPANSGLSLLNRRMRWGEPVGHQWQCGGAGRDADYDEPPVRGRPHWHLRDGLLVRRHDRGRPVRGAPHAQWASSRLYSSRPAVVGQQL